MISADERWIPTVRVKAFILDWVENNFADDGLEIAGLRGIGQLGFSCGVNPRALHRIIAEERPNVTFDLVDRILTGTDNVHLWHVQPELGGFSDCYQDELPVPAPESVDQLRHRMIENAKRSIRKSRLDCHWLDVLHERALEEAAA